MRKILPVYLFFFVIRMSAQVFTYSAGPVNMTNQPGGTMLWSVTFSNPTASAITVAFDRYTKYNPPYWYSCFCYTTCNPPTTDFMNINLAPNSSTMMTVLFKTDSVNPGQATSSIRFYETGFTSNADTVHLTATTTLATGIKNISNDKGSGFPNPVQNEFTFIASENTDYQIVITDITGKVIYRQTAISEKKQVIRLQDQVSGQYFLKALYDSGKIESTTIIKN